jgi:hypothetical protein
MRDTNMADAKQIAETINARGLTYFGATAKGWTGNGIGRIYFGRDYVTIEANGEVHNRKDGKARATTAGASAVEIVESCMTVAEVASTPDVDHAI